MREDRNPRVLLWCGVASVVLLTAFVALHQIDETIMKLPAHWIGLAVLPVIVGLFVGGYITKMKGWGLELEAALKAPVATVPIKEKPEETAGEALAEMDADEKGNPKLLASMPIDRKQSLKRLKFIHGKSGYYTRNAVAEYLRALPNVEYLEIENATGGIDAVLPISAVNSDQGRPDQHKIEKLVDALGSGSVDTAFAREAVKLKVNASEGLMTVLQKMRDANVELAAVVDTADRYQGLVLARDVERRIADTVLRSELRTEKA